jgi:hypothetical protein
MTLAHVVPFCITAGVLLLVEPWLVPMSVLALVQAWVIPELYANRGAKVVKPQRRQHAAAESTALGLLGDLVDHDARDLHARSGLVREPGRLGTWLVGEAGALLVRGRRVHCFCVRVNDPDLPAGGCPGRCASRSTPRGHLDTRANWPSERSDRRAVVGAATDVDHAVHDRSLPARPRPPRPRGARRRHWPRRRQDPPLPSRAASTPRAP